MSIEPFLSMPVYPFNFYMVGRSLLRVRAWRQRSDPVSLVPERKGHLPVVLRVGYGPFSSFGLIERLVEPACRLRSNTGLKTLTASFGRPARRGWFITWPSGFPRPAPTP